MTKSDRVKARTLSRRPPKAVRDVLCAEVGFRCPMPDCGSPYLTFHHFAPTWREKHHHDPGGMVALCSVHAAKADNGYYPDEYFRTLKQEGLGRAEAVRGEFDYLRHEILAVVGSVMYIRTDTILEINGERCIYFNRDEHGYLLLNFKMPAVAGEPRAWLEDNVWIVPPAAKNVECPPRGRYLAVKFENGDSFRIEFSDVQSIAALGRRYPDADCDFLESVLDFPVTVAEFWERSQSGGIQLGRTAMRLPGGNKFSGGVIVDCGVGISVKLPKSQLFGGRLGRQSLEAVARALAEFNGRAAP